ncbi:MAG TPA: hypothetical protein VFF06_25080, partial [Polyangia bacterium]|nr:hypothetical protein [Polyangia bacterium]
DRRAMLQVFAGPFFVVAVDARARLVRVTRTARQFTAVDEMQRAHKEVLRAVAPYLEHRLLLDVRDGPSRNDPDYEKGMASLRKAVIVRFERVAILVRSNVGKLHVTRLAREDGVRLQAFQDEAEAIAYLCGAST